MRHLNNYEPIAVLERGGLTECTYYGNISMFSGEKCWSFGNSENTAFYRSASKPIQALPVVYLGLKDKYGITDEELAVMCGSQRCELSHIPYIESLMEKTKVKYDNLVMLPTYPLFQEARDYMIREDKPKSKLYHNCIGKHIACNIVQRELGGNEADYYKPDSLVQKHILGLISDFSETEATEVVLGTDGCGVPVFGVKSMNIAKSFLKLVKPEMVRNSDIRSAAEVCVKAVQTAPRLYSAHGHIDTIISGNENMICKQGALGIQCLGLKDEGIGFFIKLADGSYDLLNLITIRLLEQIGYKDKELINELKENFPESVKNDCGMETAVYKLLFEI